MQMTDKTTTEDDQGSPAPARQWPVRVTLKHPIEFGKETIEVLEFRRGRMGDLKGMKIDSIPPVDQLITLAARMSNQFTAVIDRLDAEDSGEVLAIALEFFTNCLVAGSRPSQS